MSDQETVSEFDEVFYGTLESTRSIEMMLNGYPTHILLNALNHAMSDLADRYSESALGAALWNPITAALFEQIKCVIQMETSQQAELLSTRLTQCNVDVSSSRKEHIPAPVTQSLQPPGGSKKAGESKVTKNVKEQCPAHVESIVRSNFSRRRFPVFKNQAFVTCKTVDCAFCKQLWSATELTKCSNIRRHKKGVTCNREGWYAHVFPPMWSKLVADHDSGLAFPGLDKYLRVKQAEHPTAKPIPNGKATFASVVRARKRQPEDDLEDITDAPESVASKRMDKESDRTSMVSDWAEDCSQGTE